MEMTALLGEPRGRQLGEIPVGVQVGLHRGMDVSVRDLGALGGVAGKQRRHRGGLGPLLPFSRCLHAAPSKKAISCTPFNLLHSTSLSAPKPPSSRPQVEGQSSHPSCLGHTPYCLFVADSRHYLAAISLLS